MAAGFFILAGSGRDAVGVLAREAADPQLAIFVARLLEGTTGPLQVRKLALLWDGHSLAVMQYIHEYVIKHWPVVLAAIGTLCAAWL